MRLKRKLALIGCILSLFLSNTSTFAQSNIVEKYGQLSVKGNYIVGQYGDTVQLRGMSLFWSQWMSQYYNPYVVKFLKDKWKSTVIRAAMGVEMGGYADSRASEREKVMTIVDAAIRNGIYVIIDYHSHEAHTSPDMAKKFLPIWRRNMESIQMFCMKYTMSH